MPHLNPVLAPLGKPLTDLLPAALAVVNQAVEFIAREAAQFSSDKIEYKGTNDLVSYVDRETEKLLVAGLSHVLPGSTFMTEEGTVTQADLMTGVPTWIIDPLDGTTNFSHGLPPYAVSVALALHGEIILGIVAEVTHREVFAAYKGGGAWCNGKPIHVTPVKELKHVLLATGFPYNQFKGVEKYLNILHNLMPVCHGLRRMGSASVDLSYVACGRFQGFFEYNLKPWDVAAGALIVREAGGFVSDFSGGPNWLLGNEIIAAGPVHSQLQHIIHKEWTV